MPIMPRCTVQITDSATVNNQSAADSLHKNKNLHNHMQFSNNNIALITHSVESIANSNYDEINEDKNSTNYSSEYRVLLI